MLSLESKECPPKAELAASSTYLVLYKLYMRDEAEVARLSKVLKVSPGTCM